MQNSFLGAGLNDFARSSMKPVVKVTVAYAENLLKQMKKGGVRVVVVEGRGAVLRLWA